VLRFLSRPHQSCDRDRPENRSVDNLFGSNSPDNQSTFRAWMSPPRSGIHWANKKKTVLPCNPSPFAGLELGAGDSVAADDYDLGHGHQSWLIECDAPVKTGQATLVPWTGLTTMRLCATKGWQVPPLSAYCLCSIPGRCSYFKSPPYGYANYFFQTNEGPSFPSHHSSSAAPRSRERSRAHVVVGEMTMPRAQ